MEENKHNPIEEPKPKIEEKGQKIEPKIEKKDGFNQEKKPVKHKSEVAQTGLITLQYLSLLLAILSLIASIFVAVAPKKVSSLLLTQQILEQPFVSDYFYFVVPHYCIMLAIIALLFYFISVLIRLMVRYRREVNQLQKELEKN